jgi:hypothetical protein
MFYKTDFEIYSKDGCLGFGSFPACALISSTMGLASDWGLDKFLCFLTFENFYRIDTVLSTQL